MMFAVTNNGSGKDDVSVFGSYTYAADLAHYSDQILSIVDSHAPDRTTGENRESHGMEPEALRQR